MTWFADFWARLFRSAPDPLRPSPDPAPSAAPSPAPLVTLTLVRAVAPESPLSTLAAVVQPLDDAARRFGINTPQRVAMFLAQVAHESGGFRYVREIGGGARYEGRRDLGNVNAGDGALFCGRGFMQCTGRDNYRAASLALFGDLRLLTAPDLLEHFDNAAASAGWFWQAKRLNEFADVDDFTGATRRINGGLNGIADRQRRYSNIRQILGLT